ncbi:MAG: cyclodeaminase/cyclohydrolase family protein [Candidatus Rokubacteria bacterium]|nr:cyclodeaminase/cyclohydrolase family protein [Candidatus Rokubacteria bacterium]
MATSSDFSDAVATLLAAFAAPAPTPAGGAAAALSAGVAAALLVKVCTIAARHAAAGALDERRREAERLAHGLAALAVRDATAFDAVLAAQREGGEALTRALHAATDTVLDVARSSAGVIATCLAVAPAARPATRSDVAVAASLAWGALQGATLTAHANLAGLASGPFVERGCTELDRLMAEGGEGLKRVLGALLEDVRGA